MNSLIEIFNWIAAHPIQALSYLALAQSTASMIANLTPTKKDDAAVNGFFKVIHVLALNFFHLRGIGVPDDPAATSNKKEE